MRRLPILIIVSLFAAGSLRAALVFDLAGDATVETLDGSSTLSLTQSGVTATLAALIDGATDSSAQLNTTSSSFGINAAGSGDATSELDGVNGAEAIKITFNKRITFESIDVSSLGSGDQGTLTLAGGSPQTFTSSGTVSGGSTLEIGESAIIAWTAGNGFSFDRFAVTIPADDPPGGSGSGLSAIPEPAALPWLLLFGGTAYLAFRPRRDRRRDAISTMRASSREP